jgi:pyruvate formate lyase activating enzyme
VIAGLVPCSFIDYPGQLAAVVFTRGCNLRCFYCHNPSLVTSAERSFWDEDRVLEFLARRRGRLGGVVVSGGEPTLYGGLAAFIGRVKQLGFQVKLDTNGTRPEVLRSLLAQGVLDYVAMDVKDVWSEYAATCGAREDPQRIAESLRLLITSGVAHEARTTVLLPYHDEARLARIARQLTGVRRWILQPFRLGATLAPCAKAAAPTTHQLSQAAATIQLQHGLNCAART